jgi:hypothetical protein
LLCLALDDRPLFLTEATRLLFQQMPGSSRRLLGVPGTAGGERAFLAACRRGRYCFRQICDVAPPPPSPSSPTPPAARKQPSTSSEPLSRSPCESRQKPPPGPARKRRPATVSASEGPVTSG